jgi:hypothetical protein
LVEGGSWALGKSESQRFQSLFVAKMMGVMGYDVVNVGPNDLLYGLETLRKTAEDAGFTLVSSNIVKKSTGKHLFEPFVIKDVGGVKVAFLGIVDEKARLQSATNELDDFAILNPHDALNEFVPKVRKKRAELVVVFTHVGNRKSQQLVDEVEGVDIALNGGDPLVNQKPAELGNEEVGKRLVCSAGDRGKYIGALKVVMDENGKMLRWSHELHALDKNVKEDEDMAERVAVFKEELREVRKREQVEAVVGGGGAGGVNKPQEKFLGANICRRCHVEEWKAWQETAHAHSMASIEGKAMESSQECLKCHVTGFHDPVGYFTNKANLGNVSCEQCHGQGTLHGEVQFIAKPSVESCRVCHDHENSPRFDYDKYWEAIAH